MIMKKEKVEKIVKYLKENLNIKGDIKITMNKKGFELNYGGFYTFQCYINESVYKQIGDFFATVNGFDINSLVRDFIEKEGL